MQHKKKEMAKGDDLDLESNTEVDENEGSPESNGIRGLPRSGDSSEGAMLIDETEAQSCMDSFENNDS